MGNTRHTKHAKKQKEEKGDVRTVLASVSGAAATGTEF